MPYEKGGRADKRGNRYEINCIVYELLKVLEGSNYSVVIEALGEDEIGTDILVTNKNGTIEHQQCKGRNGSSEVWSVSDLKTKNIISKWKFQLDRDNFRRVALVSPMVCSFLVDLNDRANNTSGKTDDFYKFQILKSSKEFQDFYNKICKEMDLEIERCEDVLKSIDYLKRIYYKQISEYEIQERINQSIQYQFSSPKNFVYDALVSMIVSEDILGKEITQIMLIDYIEKRNIRFQPREDDSRVIFRIQELNKEYKESYRTFQEGLIHRQEFEDCIKYLVDEKEMVITGNAGYGKSGCTEAILNFCEENNIPCIAIKLDRRIPHKNCKIWGEELGLPGSIGCSIHNVSKNQSSVIILDQLDALRWTQANSSEALSVCMELIRQVRYLNYNREKKIIIIFVCRTYDLENDNNIKMLFEEKESGEEAWKVVEIGKFGEEDIKKIVGSCYDDLSIKLKRLLQIPSNLYIWQHLDQEQMYKECLTTSHLIDKWFDQICKKANNGGVNHKIISETTNKIVDVLDKSGRLFIPKIMMDIDVSALEYLISAEMIVLQNNKIGFVHQSILDYFISRRMLEKYFLGVSIEDIIGEKEKQTPGKRYQLQMFLQNILENDTSDFISIGEEMLASDNIRYYMKFVFYELMGQIQKPDKNVSEFFVKNCDDIVLGKYLVNNVALYKKQYINILIENGTLERWYADETKRAQVFMLLMSISVELENNAVGFIKRHAFEDENCDKEFLKCFLHGVSQESDEMFELRMLFYEHYPDYALNDFIDMKSLMTNYEKRALRLLSFWADQKINSKGKSVYRYEETLADEASNYTVKNEELILDKLLKYIPKEKGYQIKYYSKWSNRYVYSRGIERVCVDLIKKANVVLCSKQPEKFWEYYNEYMGKDYVVFNEIILHGLAFLPPKYSDQVIRYIGEDFDKNILDYTSGAENLLELAKKVLKIHTETCSEKELKRLEKKIYYYNSPDSAERYKRRIEQNKKKEYEPVYWSFWGDLQYELLQCIPQSRMDEKSKELLEILKRKFDKQNSRYYFYSGHSGSVFSPVAGKRIGKKQWLQIITNNHIKNKRDVKWREVQGGFIESSLETYASDFQNEVSQEPREMIKLVVENKEQVLPEFVDSLFAGIEISEKIKQIDLEMLEELFVLFPCDLSSQRAIYFCEIIEKKEETNWKDAIIIQLKRIATEHSDPKMENDEKIKASHELRNCSFGSARGCAARTIGHLLWKNRSLFAEFKETINKMAMDINPAVRMATLNALFPAYNIEREWASETILQIYEADIRSMIFYDSKQILILLYPKYRERVCNLIKESFETKDKEIEKIGGYTACELYILHGEFESLMWNVSSKSPEGVKAILDMAVIYLKFEEYREKSKDIILNYLDVDADIEGSISSIFYDKDKYVDVKRDKDFLIKLMNSKVSKRIVYAFSSYLEKTDESIVDYADIIFELCDNVLNMSEEKLRDFWEIDRAISKLIITLYDETSNTNRETDKVIANRCLEFWDIMFERQLGSVREISKKLMDR